MLKKTHLTMLLVGKHILVQDLIVWPAWLAIWKVLNPDPSVIRQKIIVTEDKNGKPTKVPETVGSNGSSIIIKDENGNLINPDDAKAIRKSIIVTEDENGNPIE